MAQARITIEAPGRKKEVWETDQFIVIHEKGAMSRCDGMFLMLALTVIFNYLSQLSEEEEKEAAH